MAARKHRVAETTSFPIRLGPELVLDAQTVLEDRLYIGAQSGSGKTHTVRLFVEAASSKIPTIIFDAKSEYATLREKYDFVLVGNQGEVVADVRTAARLAKQLIHKRLNAIIDLPSVGPRPQQQEYIKAFLDAIEALPQSMWGPTFFVIDEVHRFCPEKGNPVSKNAIITLIDSGRVKGFCAVIVSQRQVKVAADARSECANILQGRATFPVELRAAADLLGLIGKEDWDKLKKLRVGEFYAIGPAFATQDLHKGRTFAHTKTTHLSGSNRFVTPPSPSRRIKEIVGELDELLRQPEPVVETPGAAKKLQARIKELEAKLAVQPKTVTTVTVDESAVRAAFDKGWTNAVEAAKQELLPKILASRRSMMDLSDVITGKFLAKPVRLSTEKVAKASTANSLPAAKPVERRVPPLSVQRESHSALPKRGGMRRILIVLAQLGETGADRTQLALMAQMAQSGTFDTYLSSLKSNAWIEMRDKRYYITAQGVEALGNYEPLPTGRQLIDYWLGYVSQGGERRMLQALVDAAGEELTREELAERSGMQLSGTFDTYLSKLKGLKLVEGSKRLKLSQTLLEALQDG